MRLRNQIAVLHQRLLINEARLSALEQASGLFGEAPAPTQLPSGSTTTALGPSTSSSTTLPGESLFPPIYLCEPIQSLTWVSLPPSSAICFCCTSGSKDSLSWFCLPALRHHRAWSRPGRVYGTVCCCCRTLIPVREAQVHRRRASAPRTQTRQHDIRRTQRNEHRQRVFRQHGCQP